MSFTGKAVGKQEALLRRHDHGWMAAAAANQHHRPPLLSINSRFLCFNFYDVVTLTTRYVRT